MIRWLSILLALVAQCSAMASPFLLRHCTGADGQQRIELQGQACACSEVEHQTAQDSCSHEEESEPRGCCGSSAGAKADEPQSNDVSKVVAVHHTCDCEHSPFEVIQVRIERSEALLWQVFIGLCDVDFLKPHAVMLAPVRVAERELRPDPDSHLAVLAGVVLRV